MLIFGRNFARHRSWVIACVLITVAACAWYVIAGLASPQWPGGSSLPGLVFGVAGGAIILFEFLLWPRKALFRARRIGRTESWMRAHIWLGLLTVPLILLHSGGHLMSGQLSTLLMVLFAITILSGIFGLTVQQFLPRMMFDSVPAETIYSQIDYVARQDCLRAEELVLATCGASDDFTRLDPLSDGNGDSQSFVTVGAVRSVGSVQGKVLETQAPARVVPNSEALRTSFYEHVAPYLLHGRKSASMLNNPARAADLFASLQTRLDPAAQPALDALQSLCLQRRQFDVQSRIHRWMHVWLMIHLPVSVALTLLMFVHIYYALKYW